MKINYVPKDFKLEVATPSIKFGEYDGYYDACIYIDHICVGYFTSDGMLAILPIETDEREDSTEKNDLVYLEQKGFKFEEEKIDENKSKFYLKVERG